MVVREARQLWSRGERTVCVLRERGRRERLCLEVGLFGRDGEERVEERRSVYV